MNLMVANICLSSLNSEPLQVCVTYYIIKVKRKAKAIPLQA
jgi:hypothetical protein